MRHVWPLVGTVMLTVLLMADFIFDALNVLRSLIPATRFVDILHLRLRWPQCGGVPVRLSQSPGVIREGFIAVGRASGTDYDTHAVAGGNHYGRVRVRRG